MAAVVLVIVGLVLAGWGARAAGAGRRPLDLVGALAAAAGVLVALLGAIALAAPGFL